VGVLRVVEHLLAREALSARSLLDELGVRWLGEAELLADRALAADDPKLDSLVNVNTPDEYRAALQRRQESASRSGLV
jgi:molybdopterin-guanine dinucleotide biosynthesis protein A